MAKTSYLREAASVMIVGRSSTTSVAESLAEKSHPSLSNVTSKFDYKVLLLKRASQSKFLPNMYIFPGRVLHKTDFSDGWLNLLNKNEFPTYNHSPPAFKKEIYAGLPNEVAFSICATREAFEESGILLCSDQHGQPININNLNESDVTEWRGKVQKDPTEFMKMCQNFGFSPDIKQNYLWANWQTPAHMEASHGGTTRSFDTLFYIHGLSNIPEEQHDEMETVSSQWATPPEIVYHHRKKNIMIGLPQLYELCRLCHYPKYDDLYNHCKERAKHGVSQYVGIRHDANNGHMLVLPGDSIYPGDPIECEKAGPVKVPKTTEESTKAATHLNRTTWGMDLSINFMHDMVLHCTTGNECGHHTPIPEKQLLKNVCMDDKQ